MKKAKTIALIAAMVVCGQSWASQPPPQLTKFGGTDCGTWLKESGVKKEADLIWIAGFLTGVNMMYAEKMPASAPQVQKDPLEQLQSMDQAGAWMDNYCQKQPLSDILEGAELLFLQLISKAGGA